MQQINPAQALQTAQRNASARSPSETASTSTPEPLGLGVLARLWIAAIAIWGAKWIRYCGELPIDGNGRPTFAGALWAQGLAGFGEDRIMRTLERLAMGGTEWPPDLPQMRRACFGIPSVETVRRDLHTRSLGFTRLVWQQLDHWAFSRAEQHAADRMLREAYDVAVERRLHGAQLPAKPAGELTQDAPKPNPASAEVARARIAEIRAELDHLPQPPKASAEREVPLFRVEQDLREHYAHQHPIPNDPTGEVDP